MTTPTSDLDGGLAKIIQRGRLVLPVAIVFLILVVGILAFGVTYLFHVTNGEQARTTARIQHTTESMCGFFGSLGTASLTTTSAELGSTLVIDGRNIYFDLQCKPTLAPPDQITVDLAAKYHLKFHK